jgi:hypothetical protein
MNKAQQTKFDLLYQQHISALRRQGKDENTIDGYSRALWRITEFFDLCPDKLTQTICIPISILSSRPIRGVP